MRSGRARSRRTVTTMADLRRAPILLAVTAAAAALALAGCTPTPAPTVTTTVTKSASPTPSASGSAAPATQCADSALQITVTPDPGGGAAGSAYYDVVFTNAGSKSCTLGGQPGVSVVDSSDTQLGRPATSNGAAPPYRAIASGGAVYALLRVSNPQNFSGCTVVDGAAWAVYAPGSRARVIVPSSTPVPACSPGPVFMSVAAVLPGTHA